MNNDKSKQVDRHKHRQVTFYRTQRVPKKDTLELLVERVNRLEVQVHILGTALMGETRRRKSRAR